VFALGNRGLAQFYYYLAQLSQWCVFRDRVAEGELLATLIPISFYFVYAGEASSQTGNTNFRDSPFTRAEGGADDAGVALSYGRIVLHDWRAAALIHALSRPRPADRFGRADPTSFVGQLQIQLMTLLLNAGHVTRTKRNRKISGGRESFPPIMGIPRPANFTAAAVLAGTIFL